MKRFIKEHYINPGKEKAIHLYEWPLNNYNAILTTGENIRSSTF